MTTAERPFLLQHLWKSTLASGVLTVIVGALVLAWPRISLLVVAVLFGAYLLVSGVAQVFSAFSLHASASGRVLLFLSGAASLILAVLAFRHLGDAIVLLAIWIGIGFVFRGVATIVAAISEPGLPARGWQIIFGVVTIVAGTVVLASPLRSLITLALVAGISLIFTGVFEVISSFGIRRAAKNVESFQEMPGRQARPPAATPTREYGNPA